jgi:hypothetical protein
MPEGKIKKLEVLPAELMVCKFPLSSAVPPVILKDELKVSLPGLVEVKIILLVTVILVIDDDMV